MILTSLTVVFIVIGSVTGADYCALGSNHIGCNNNGNFASTCPKNAYLVTMTNELKDVLLTAHNGHRNYVAAGKDSNHRAACRMATMQWDNELEYLASLNVKQCKMSHDKNHNTATFKYSGQNLGWAGFSGPVDHKYRLKQIVDNWYSEIKDSRQSNIDSYPNQSTPVIGHFTVMVADRNIRVGCAAAVYGNTEYLVACNYATTNMIGHPIYKSCSVPASECSSGVNSQYTNLCSISESYNVNQF